ncbi:hypothetical protein GGI07_000430 [Coemansia sp. Benny D115]|nr:hypothetical protein GGI07_000430 [Coemansia sp. Benny D115]
MVSPDQQQMALFSEILLLDSFMDQAARHALSALTIRSSIGIKQEADPAWSSSDDATQLRSALAAMQPETEAVFAIVERLRQRTDSQPTEGMRIRWRVYELLRAAFDDLLGDAQGGPEWAVMRPTRTPQTLVQMLMAIAAHTAAVGLASAPNMSEWQPVFMQLLAQLALSENAAGNGLGRIQEALELVQAERTIFVASLCDTDNSAELDAEWKQLSDLISAVQKDGSADAQQALRQWGSCWRLLEALARSLTSVLDALRPPMLDMLNSIRQTGQIPDDFFHAKPELISLQLGSHAAAHQVIGGLFNGGDNEGDEDGHSDVDGDGGHRLALLDPFASHAYDDMPESPSELAVITATRNHARRSRTSETPSSPRSPTDDTQMQRRLRMSGLNLPANARLPLLALGGELGLETSDVDMSPSYQASVRRQSALLNRHASEGAMDVEGTNVLAAQSPHPASSPVTTPRSQTGENAHDRPRYVADWAQGDMEGGGRLHRRRAHEATPRLARATLAGDRPPATILSPRLFAAAANHRKTHRRPDRADDASARENRAADEPNIGGLSERLSLLNTPKPSGAGPSADTMQITPENQIGVSADFRAWSASRYVLSKDQGDTAGGGRKHRKRPKTTHKHLRHLVP